MKSTTWRMFHDPDAFVVALGSPLLEREIENCLPLAICWKISRGIGQEREAFMYLSEAEGETAGAAVRTPGRNVVLFSGPIWREEDFCALTDALLAEGIDVPGVIGPSALARAFSDVWCNRRGTAASVRMELGLYGLVEVRSTPGPGMLVQATPVDSDLFWSWEQSFYIDCFGEMPPYVTREGSDRLVAEEGIYFWVVDGAKVSMAGANRSTGISSMVNLVYTPPSNRSQGYATSLVSALSSRLLESGYRCCTLFTDLSNPVSNGIYRKIGYEYAGDFTEMVFTSGI